MLFAVPPADELRRLVYQHGGRYQQYYSKRSVTHIIATNLPNSKIQELRYTLVIDTNFKCIIVVILILQCN